MLNIYHSPDFSCHALLGAIYFCQNVNCMRTRVYHCFSSITYRTLQTAKLLLEIGWMSEGICLILIYFLKFYQSTKRNADGQLWGYKMTLMGTLSKCKPHNLSSFAGNLKDRTHSTKLPLTSTCNFCHTHSHTQKLLLLIKYFLKIPATNMC